MSVRAYFKLEDLIAAGGKIEMRNSSDGKIVLSEQKLTVNISGYEDPWIDFGSEILQATIPSGLDPKLIKRFTAYDNVYTGKRRVGEYRFRTAHGLPHLHSSAEYTYHIKYMAEKLADLQELHRQFCEGRIWPVADYEAAMVPPPARHLRQLFGEAWAIIRRDVSQRFRDTRA